MTLMTTLRSRWRATLLGLGLALLPLAPALAQDAAAAWPKRGELKYSVLRGVGGGKIGEAVHTWTQDGTRYSMQLDLKTTGLLAAVYDFSYVQTSRGRIVDGQLLSDSFRVEQTRRKPEEAVFDWQAGTVKVTRKGVVTEHPLKSGDRDVLNVWHLFSFNPAAVKPEMLLVANRYALPSTVKSEGNERIRVPLGNFDTRRYEVRTSTGKLDIDMWVSAQHHGLPVRLVLTDDKGRVLDLVAESITLN